MATLDTLPLEIIHAILLSTAERVGVQDLIKLRLVCRLWASEIPKELLLRASPRLLTSRSRQNDRFLRNNLLSFLRLRVNQKLFAKEDAWAMLCGLIRRAVACQAGHVQQTVTLTGKDTTSFVDDTCKLVCRYLPETAYGSVARSRPTSLLRRCNGVQIEVLALASAIFAGREDLVRAIATPELAKRRAAIAGLPCPLTIATDAEQIPTMLLLLSITYPNMKTKPELWLSKRLDNEIEKAHASKSYGISHALICVKLEWENQKHDYGTLCDWLRMAAFGEGHNLPLVEKICGHIKRRNQPDKSKYAVSLIALGLDSESVKLARELLDNGLLGLDKGYLFPGEGALRRFQSFRHLFLATCIKYFEPEHQLISVLGYAVKTGRIGLAAFLLEQEKRMADQASHPGISSAPG
ncbi:hypothetical protein HBI80_238720 [Parastagonospora nodorum]|nr:hypothetical protein HBI80_238720 [Parastagonospora nodorum]KAH4914888.1 hypothetical protein HBH73_243710 [Parastagonospora nodorum]KAH5389767.1 hypothetical protein HBI32_247810 [Parastagonospora nodorum]KAH5703787.1 hypothetical protein HBI20_243170 [Parastagonospora nodorum]KAH6384699.1 hypothetical protein HBI60_241150 [Parastagonospora nodorum]